MSCKLEDSFPLVANEGEVGFVYEVGIPANTTATVILPQSKETKELGSGKYQFSYPWVLLDK